MAESTAQLNILVKVRDEASASLSRLSNDVSDLGGSLNFASLKGGILAGAIAAISGAALFTAAKAFAEGELALSRMDAILKTIPDGFNKYRALILQAADGALKFGFDNEGAALQITKLFKATGDLPFALKAFQAAMDLARLKGISLEDATRALTLSFQGGGRILKEFGIQVDDHASKETILAAVIGHTAGQAQAFTETATGMWEQLKIIGGEILDVVGEPFVKTFDLIAGSALKSFDLIIRLINETLKPLILGLVPIFTAVFVGSLGVILAFALQKFGLLALGFIGYFGLGGLLIGVFVGFMAVMISNWEQFRAAGKLAMDGIKSVWQEGWNFIQNIVSAVLGTVQGYVNSIVAAFQMVREATKAAGAFVGSGATTVIQKILGLVGLQEGGIVTRPTAALLGEGGEREAVIPLSKLGSLAGGGGITINIMGDMFTTREVAERFGNEIASIIKYQLKL